VELRAEPFEITIADPAIADLQARLARTRFAPDLDNDDWSYGVPTAVLRDWVGAWQRFDWRRTESELNRFDNYRVELDGLPIHFVHRSGIGPAPVPLILSHGWPWTYWDWHATIDLLADPNGHGGDPADAFDVVVPSLPGFGFSSPITRPVAGITEVARLWARLMTEVLGYDRFAAAGGDFGNIITGMLGHAHADRVIGIHLLGAVPLASPGQRPVGDPPWESDWGFAPPATRTGDPVLFQPPLTEGCPLSSHRAVHTREPQTLAAALHDSPAGMMAWLLKSRHFWRDFRSGADVRSSFSEEFLLTTFSLYWYTETLWSSIRLYRAAAEHPVMPVHDRQPMVEVPTGITFFEHDQTSRSRFWVPDHYNVIRTSYSAEGGHFAPAEQPLRVVEEIRETFRQLRSR